MRIRIVISDNTLAGRYLNELSPRERGQAVREALTLYAASQSGTSSVPLPSLPLTVPSKIVPGKVQKRKETVVVSPDPVPVTVPTIIVREEVLEKGESGEVAAKLASPDGGDISGLLKEW